jgi:hypothetical protein
MVVTIILTLLGACVGLLAGYCATKARANTTPAGVSLAHYNSNASAVSGIWLFFSIWFVSPKKAAYAKVLT